MPIVVGVDGSPESIRALRWALEEARLRKTAVRAVLAWEYPIAAGGGDLLMGPGFDPMPVELSTLREWAKERLADAVRRATTETDAVVQELAEGHAAAALCDAAKDAEMLVLGSRGHGGFGGLLLGSVSQACAHHAHCPVVIVRPAGPESPSG